MKEDIKEEKGKIFNLVDQKNITPNRNLGCFVFLTFVLVDRKY